MGTRSLRTSLPTQARTHVPQIVHLPDITHTLAGLHQRWPQLTVYTHIVKRKRQARSLRWFTHSLKFQTVRGSKSFQLQKLPCPQTNSTASNPYQISTSCPRPGNSAKAEAPRIIKLWWEATALSTVPQERGAVPLWPMAGSLWYTESQSPEGGDPGTAAYLPLIISRPRAQGWLTLNQRRYCFLEYPVRCRKVLLALKYLSSSIGSLWWLISPTF